MSATAGQAGPEQASEPAAERTIATKLGLKPGQVVQELGYDDDSDHDLRTAVATLVGSELVDEDFEEAVDTVLLWWREDDGDLVDALVDSLTSLTSGGVIWLLTPKIGRDGHVEPEDIGEAAPTAGLSSTSTVAVGKDWSGTRLVAPKLHR